MNRRLSSTSRLAVIALAYFSVFQVAHSNEVAISGGEGSDARVYGVQFVASPALWSKKFSDKWQGSLRVEASIGNVAGRGSGGSNSVIVGASPMLRLTMVDSPLYAEVGIGVNYFDNKRINASKEMGTHFQFGDMLGVGVRLTAEQVHLGYRFIHYSNAGISSSNPGLDLHMLSLKVSF